MKSWVKFLIVLIVCILVVGGVYVWRFGLPAFLSRDERYVNELYSHIILEDENIEKKVENKKIIFTQNSEEAKSPDKLDTQEGTDNDKTSDSGDVKEPKIIEFILENGVISATIDEDKIPSDFADKVIRAMFIAAVNLNEQSEENAIYSLIPDVLADKKLQEDGYQQTSQNGVTRFSMKANKKFILANGEDVYIKIADLEKVADLIKYKLQDKIIEKPGIIFEKAISYSNNLVYVIYERGKLTNRTYNSFLSLISTVMKDKNKVEYVKENYPSITRAGTLTLNGITISLNENLAKDNIHMYDIPDEYEYMIIWIDVNEIER